MPLIDYFIPLLASLCEFRKAPRGDAVALASRIDALLDSARRAAGDDGLPTADYEAALFPVVAWADEALLSLDWAGSREWPRRLLQKRYFNLSTAGIEFFKRLDQLGRDAAALKEVYFVCLCLGFQGRYSYERNLKALADIREQLLSTLTPKGALASDLLIPEGYQSKSEATTRQSQRRWNWRFSSLSSATFAFPLLVLIVLYGVYYLSINHMVNAITQLL